jgi:gliding motility-associated-like protein
MFRYIFIIIIIINSVCLKSQNQIHNILINSGEDVIRLNFDKGEVNLYTTGTNSGGGIGEGIAHMEDADGNIIFYVNASGFYDRNYDLMSGSSGLFFSTTSTEVNICPFPGKKDKYFIFYNILECSNLYYSVVDMKQNGGLGKVELLNIQLGTDDFSEGREIVSIPGTEDFWLLAYKCGQGIASFKIDKNGVGKENFIYNYYKESPAYDGRGEFDYHKGKIGIAFTYTGNVLIADFNPVNGDISNDYTFVVQPDKRYSYFRGIYGLEFSPDGNMLYLSDWARPVKGNLCQFDLVNKKFINNWNIPGVVGFGQIELGPDGKLYSPQTMGTKITTIDNADSKTPVIGELTTPQVYNSYGRLENVKLSLGISDFIQSSVYKTNSIAHRNSCAGDTTYVNLVITKNIDSVIWNFGDSLSSCNISTDFKTHHIYYDKGEYTIETICFYNDKEIDTFYKTIQIIDVPVTYLGKDTSICNNLHIDISLHDDGHSTYLWNNYKTTPDFTISDTGLYWVKVTNLCGSITDTIIVKPYDIKATFDFEIDTCSKTIFCKSLSDSTNEFSWYLNNLKVSQEMNPVFRLYPKVKNEILLKVQNKNGCKDQIVKEVDMSEDIEIYVSNVFTPNNDGINDVFKSKGIIRNCSEYKLLIYNRWGVELYESSFYSNVEWDGYFKNKLVSPGVYFYVIESNGFNQTGTIQVIY